MSFPYQNLLQIIKYVCEREKQILYIKDKDGKYLYMHPELLEFINLKESKVLGKTELEIFSEEIVNSNHFEDLSLIENKKSFKKANLEWDIKPCEGALFFKEPILNDSQEVIGLLCTIQTGFQEKLISNTILEEFERESLAGTWILNLSEFEFSISKGLAAILGIEFCANLSFSEYFELTYPEDKTLFEKLIVEAIQEGKNFFTERSILNFLKKEKILLEYVLAIHNGSNIQELYGIVIDITQPYTQRQELEKQKFKNELEIIAQAKELKEVIQSKNKLLLKYQAFLNSLGEISYEINPATHEIKWNGETEKILGYSIQEMPKNWNEYLKFIHSEDIENIDLKQNPSLTSINPYSFEYRIKTSFGTYKWILDKGYKVIENNQILEIVGVIRDIHELKTSIEKMKELAFKDELTGIYNRRGIFQLLEKTFFQAQRYGLNLELYYCDLNDFKKINDEFGHDIGDSALIDFTNILKRTLRKSDTLGRVGGDEFIFFAISNTFTKSNIENRLKKAVEDFNHSAGRPYKLSFSLGKVKYDPLLHISPDDLISEADFLMYQNKRLIKGLK